MGARARPIASKAAGNLLNVARSAVWRLFISNQVGALILVTSMQPGSFSDCPLGDMCAFDPETGETTPQGWHKLKLAMANEAAQEDDKIA
ncbi:hypothetical protein QWZ03_02815 [Chitinimonas viridis]|uniref:Uncharacterized protein n=1 Tax=Chitinimonas viridis TaxID=664880 RepID=A0ABT8B227_9NEIS|nr:hypothetical protein [Chitinimonas viridis]MDN3575701.1 hypothetical protein [Chitinimonas viridis]